MTARVRLGVLLSNRLSPPKPLGKTPHLRQHPNPRIDTIAGIELNPSMPDESPTGQEPKVNFKQADRERAALSNKLTREAYGQALNLSKLAYNNVIATRDRLAALPPPTTRAEMRDDALLLEGAMRTWRDMQEQVHRIKDRRKVREVKPPPNPEDVIVNKPPDFS